MKNSHTIRTALTGTLFAALVLGGVTGCQSTPQVQYVDPSGSGLTTVGQINFQDYNAAGIKLVESLLGSGRLDRVDGTPFIVMLSRIENRTSQHVDTALLTQNIRIALSQSGKAAFTTAVGAGGPEDAATMAVRDLRESDEFAQDTIAARGTVIAPDLSLSGRIIQQNTYAGNQRQAAYTFQLTLTNLKMGIAIWEGQEQIVKMGSRPRVGL
jgi:penicillin-binding protein activator